MRTERCRVDVLTAAVAVLATALADASLASYRIGFDKYHDYAEMTDYLTNITREFPNASSLYSIGKSVLSTLNTVFLFFVRLRLDNCF